MLLGKRGGRERPHRSQDPARNQIPTEHRRYGHVPAVRDYIESKMSRPVSASRLLQKTIPTEHRLSGHAPTRKAARDDIGSKMTCPESASRLPQETNSDRTSSMGHAPTGEAVRDDIDPMQPPCSSPRNHPRHRRIARRPAWRRRTVSNRRNSWLAGFRRSCVMRADASSEGPVRSQQPKGSSSVRVVVKP